MGYNESTSRDQLTMDKRAMPRRHLEDSIQAAASKRTDNISQSSLSANEQRSIYMQGQQKSFGASGSSGRNGSMLSNIGQSIAKGIFYC